MAVNVLRNSLKILHITRSEFFTLNVLHIDQLMSQRCRRDNLNSIWAGFSCCLSKRTVKRNFLNIYLTAFLGVRNLGNTLATMVIFDQKCSKFNVNFKYATKSSEKIFCFWDNCIWNGCVNCLYYEENTCHRQWMC